MAQTDKKLLVSMSEKIHEVMCPKDDSHLCLVLKNILLLLQLSIL